MIKNILEEFGWKIEKESEEGIEAVRDDKKIFLMQDQPDGFYDYYGDVYLAYFREDRHTFRIKDGKLFDMLFDEEIKWGSILN